MGGPAMIPPQLLQQLAQMFKNQQGGAAPGGQPPPSGGAPAGAPPMPGMPPPGMPGQGGAPDASGGGGAMPQMGPGNMQLASGKASPLIPGVAQSNQPAKQQSGIRASGIAALPFAAVAIKQKITQDKITKYRAMANEWIANKMDPTSASAMQKKAKENPDIAKALAKKDKEFVKMVDEAMKDPTSAAAQGIQQAYRDQKKEDEKAQMDQQMQERMRQMQAIEDRQRSQADLARSQAGKTDKQTDQMGQHTERDEFLAAEKGKAQTAKLQSDLDRARLQTGTQITLLQGRIKAWDGLADKNNASKERIAAGNVAGRKDVATTQVAGRRDVASIMATRKQQVAKTIADGLSKRAKSYIEQLKAVEKHRKDVQDHIDKTTHLFGYMHDDDFGEQQAMLKDLDLQQQFLDKQISDLQSDEQGYQKGGLLPPIDAASGAGDTPMPLTSGATDQPNAPQSKPPAGIVIRKLH
jgi:hypothetical protein